MECPLVQGMSSTIAKNGNMQIAFQVISLEAELWPDRRKRSIMNCLLRLQTLKFHGNLTVIDEIPQRYHPAWS